MGTQNSTMPDLEHHFRHPEVSPKRSVKRTGVEAWFPYYAGYSSSFVSEALTGLGVKPGSRILDPWNGSGTTTAVADAMGCDAIGFDINPVAGLVAAARLARAADTSHSFGLATELLAIASRLEQPVLANEPLLNWLSPRLSRRYRGIENAILDLLGSRAGSRVALARVTPPPFASFFVLCLIRAAKGFIHVKDNTNPTWVTPGKQGDAHAKTLDCAFLKMVKTCAQDAEAASLSRSSARATSSSVTIADARSLPLDADSIDAVVTSPPYCTRIDYFRATLFELAAFGIASDSARFRELRSEAMGTTLMRDELPIEIDGLPSPVRLLLQRIKKHASKASDTYYYRNFAQYFDDAARSLGEIRRVLRPRGRAVMVVQSSYYKDLLVPLGDLYLALAEGAGFAPRIVHRVPVRRVLAAINSRAAKHQPERHYTEDVVVLRRVA